MGMSSTFFWKATTSMPAEVSDERTESSSGPMFSFSYPEISVTLFLPLFQSDPGVG